MKKNKRSLTLAQRKKNLESSLYENANSLYTWTVAEAEYLLRGHATELFDVRIIYQNRGDEASRRTANIYGIVGANQSWGRYFCFYVSYSTRIWRCMNIKLAYHVVEQLIELEEINEKIKKAKAKPPVKATLVA